MKTPAFFYIIFSCLAFQGFSRSPEPVSPEAYSYPIFVVTGKQQFTGTAFFYRSGDTTFLVSNYHAIKGMSPVKQQINFSSDTLYLKYPVVGSAQTKVVAIDVSDDVTGTTELFSMVDRIDLLKIPFNVPADADLRYINDLIDPAYADEEPEQVLVFGFPTGAGAIPAFYSKQQKLEGAVNPDGFAEYDASLRVNFPAASDSAKALIGGSARYYYFLRPYAAQGYSGAPVLGRFRTPDGRAFYRFVGVVFAGQPATRQTWAIKGSVALDYLENE